MRREERFTIEQHAVVDIEMRSGSVQLRTGATGTVTVTADASAADSLDIGQIGDNVTIRATRRARSATLAVEVPTGTDVNIKAASMDVAARGALGGFRVRTASGDVTAEDVVRADVSVASGDVRIDVVRSDAHFGATSGDVSARRVGGRLSATLTSGDLGVDEVDGDAEVQSASGDAIIGRCGGASINMRTVSGDIRLGLPSGIRVEPEISTMSGKVTLPEPANAGAEGERRSVRLRLRSVSGDIRIERAR